MNWFRSHWFDLGAALAVLMFPIIILRYQEINTPEFLMYTQFVVLLLHQFEEFRCPGYFPGMLNRYIFKSNIPDRFPLNAQSAMVINVLGGWSLYFIAAWLNMESLLLCLITVTISLLNALAHVFFLNIKSKSFYNPGILTSIFGFIPISGYFFYWTSGQKLLNLETYLAGIGIGLVLSIGIPFVILRLANKNSNYKFEPRQIPQ